MDETPYLYKKLQEMLKHYDNVNTNFEADRDVLRRDLSRRFRLTNEDIKIVLKEVDGKGINKVNKRKYKIM